MKKKDLIKYISFAVFILLFTGLNIVYAKTSAKIAFCDYGGVRRTFKIVGIVINLIRIIVPLAISFVAFSKFFTLILSGKSDDLKGALMQIVKNLVAGLIIFCLPAALDFTFDSLVGQDTSGFTACTNCLLDTDHCTIPDEDPSTYEDN